MPKSLVVVILAAYLLLVSGCVLLSDRLKVADRLALPNGFRSQLIETKGFFIKSYEKKAGTEPLFVVIEGDGRAWIDKYTPSSDPTPLNPVGLRIAVSLNSENVLYLARPCQYLSEQYLQSCPDKRRMNF